ncbi:hypothetical protein FQZ97_1238840 [compost metagenome]
MGEWSDYFEDFPEENPANYDESGRYDPNGIQRQERAKADYAQQRLDEVLKQKGVFHRPPSKE